MLLIGDKAAALTGLGVGLRTKSGTPTGAKKPTHNKTWQINSNLQD